MFDMKFYFAGRTARAADIQSMRDELQELGHELSYDWTTSDLLQTRPYPEEFAAPEAKRELEGVAMADVFILIGDEGGTGMYVELGYALAQNIPIYCLGEHNDKTLFQFLPEVKRVDSFEDILNDLEITS